MSNKIPPHPFGQGIEAIRDELEAEFVHRLSYVRCVRLFDGNLTPERAKSSSLGGFNILVGIARFDDDEVAENGPTTQDDIRPMLIITGDMLKGDDIAQFYHLIGWIRAFIIGNRFGESFSEPPRRVQADVRTTKQMLDQGLHVWALRWDQFVHYSKERPEYDPQPISSIGVDINLTDSVDEELESSQLIQEDE